MTTPTIHAKPIPTRGPKYPFADLNVGQGFDVPGDPATIQRRLSASCTYWQAKLGRTFITRRTPAGASVWRTA